MLAPVAANAERRKLPFLLTAIAIAVGIAACDRPADKSASATKPELTPTTPATGAPPANPAPVMPPPAATALEQSSGQNAAQGQGGTPVPKPAQANDHSTTTTDGKQ